MKTYYYIARAKRRGHKEMYVGDGVITAQTDTETQASIKKRVAYSYRTAASRIKLVFRPQDQR